MATLQQFIDYLEEQVKNHSIYVWGGQGENYTTITEAWITRMETSPIYANRAIEFWKKQVGAGYRNVLRAFDCSGLGMYFLQNLHKMSDIDMSSATMRGYCSEINKADLKRGDWVFRQNSSGKTFHIGYVVDDALNVIEAKGRDDGVVRRGLNANGSNYWTHFGRPKWFRDEIESGTKGVTVTIQGWDKVNGKWYYYVGGKPVTGWRKLQRNGKIDWYFFDANGAMLTNCWLPKGAIGMEYYVGSSGAMVAERLALNADGVHDTAEKSNTAEIVAKTSADGWKKESNNWYYYTNGAKIIGWKEIEWNGAKSWFYFDGTGAMLTGWQKLSWNGVTNWYYFDGKGVMQAGKWTPKDSKGKEYYLTKSGAMATNGYVLSNDAKKIYFVGADGAWDGKTIYLAI